MGIFYSQSGPERKRRTEERKEGRDKERREGEGKGGKGEEEREVVVRDVETVLTVALG